METEFVLNTILYILPAYISIYWVFNITGDFKHGRFLWDCFTRLMSTLNAIICCVMVYYELNNKKLLFIMERTGDFSTYSLLLFASYLFIDGTLQLPDLITKPSFNLILSITHHFVGGYGIYLIGSERKGLFLGVYFAATEISTPLLNLCWYLRKTNTDEAYTRKLFFIFYILFIMSRIITIPILLYYLNYNAYLISELEPIQEMMVYYGSYTLVLLNTFWFLAITKKILS